MASLAATNTKLGSLRAKLPSGWLVALVEYLAAAAWLCSRVVSSRRHCLLPFPFLLLPFCCCLFAAAFFCCPFCCNVAADFCALLLDAAACCWLMPLVECWLLFSSAASFCLLLLAASCWLPADAYLLHAAACVQNKSKYKMNLKHVHKSNTL